MRVVLFISLLLLSPSLFADNPSGRAEELLDLARGAPVEVFADIAFELLSDGSIRADKRAAVIEEIFQRSGEARQPFPLKSATPKSRGGRSEYTVQASVLRLDGLSIRCRAVQSMLAVDARRARMLFDDIPPPSLPKPDCGQTVVPDIRVIFETLAAIVESGAFTAEETKKQAPLRLAERHIRAIGSSSGLAASARVMPRLMAAGLDGQALEVAFGGALVNTTDSDRAFSTEVEQGGLVQSIVAFGDLPMLSTLRSYLARHLTASRCRDTTHSASPAINLFNQRAAKVDGTDLPPLNAAELKPAKVEGDMRSQAWSNEAAMQALLQEARSLPPRGRATSDWEFRAREILWKVDDWRSAEGQDPIEFFHQRSSLAYALLDIFPAGDLNRKAIEGFAAALNSPEVIRDAPAEWLVHVRMMSLFADLFGGDKGKALASLPQLKESGIPLDAGRLAVEAMIASPNPTLALYGELAALKSGTREGAK
ncbi:MAG: hypothetical protein IH602_03165 [Bryobacteraceae bacterium]|nr:hypothetical protein [Bryobacteraceae bacterium]